MSNLDLHSNTIDLQRPNTMAGNCVYQAQLFGLVQENVVSMLYSHKYSQMNHAVNGVQFSEIQIWPAI